MEGKIVNYPKESERVATIPTVAQLCWNDTPSSQNATFATWSWSPLTRPFFLTTLKFFNLLFSVVPVSLGAVDVLLEVT